MKRAARAASRSRNTCEANKVSGAEAAEIGAHRTREKKAHLTPEEMQRFNLAWRRNTANDPREIVSAAQARRQHSQELPAIQQASARAREAVTFARDRNIEREAVVEERLSPWGCSAPGHGRSDASGHSQELRRRIAKVNSFVSVKRPTIPFAAPSPPPGCSPSSRTTSP